MEFHDYIEVKKELYDIFLQFLECEKENADEYSSQLFDAIQEQKILQDREEAMLFLHLVVQISNNHHRSPNFVPRILQIIQYFSKFIKATFNNLEIFNFFKSNKLIILYLIKCQIIVIDEKIVTEIQNTKSQLYCHFFFTEIKDFLSKQDLDSIEQELIQNDSDIFINFDYNRHIGENESYICELIRNDSVIQFIKYVNQTNLSICDTTIKPSIFETNLFLLKNSPSLIEYAAFYGAIQIFQYLRLNNVKMEPMLWLYAIHGKNADIIHILEESSIHPPFESYQICVNESIKCHHNDIARYFENKEFNGDFINYKCTFKYYNFDQIPDELPSKSIFWYLIFYNYYKLVKIYLKLKRKNIEDELIDQVYNKFIFLKLISYNFNDILLIFFLFCFKNTRSS